MPDLLIRTLKKMQSNLVFEEIADIFWLAAHMGEATFDISERLQNDEVSRSKLNTSAVPSPRSVVQTTSDTVQTDISDGARKNLYDQTATRGRGAGSSGIPVRVAGMSALTGERAIGRALRPLMRRVATRDQFVLNEEATVRSIADAKILMPVLQAARNRWLDVALVVEESPSMVMWRETIADFERLLEQQGAFRSLQTWYFATYPDDRSLCLYPNRTALANQSGRRSPSELNHPRNQRLILVLSDCIAPAWHDNRAATFVNSWAKSNLVALIHMLPQRLWTRTGLRTATKLYLRARTPGLVNRYLEKQWILDQRPDEDNHSMVPVPVVSLEPGSLATWAQLVVGGGKRLAWGVIFSNSLRNIEAEELDEDHNLNLTAHQLVKNFQAVASPLAQRLAGYLSAVPLSLPVMHLVQRNMLPESTQSHLAEVLLSGLIWQRTPYTPSLQPHKLRLEFVEGVREVLRTIVPRSRQFNVLHCLSTFVDKKTGKKVFDFTALLADSDAVGSFQLDAESEPFATIAIDVLNHLGGQYRQLAERLSEKLNKSIERPEPAKPQKKKISPTKSVDKSVNPPRRIGYRETPPERRLSRAREAEEVFALLEQAVAGAQNQALRSRIKRLFLIQGEPGVGKSWFLEYLQETIKTRQPTWTVVTTKYPARAFMNQTPYHDFLAVLQSCDRALRIGCLGDLPQPEDATIELVVEWAAQLDEKLNQLPHGPLLLFFDELEWWAGIGEPYREIINRFYRVVWQMLLRKVHVPCLIICAARRPPPFNNPLLRLALSTYSLKGFSAEDLGKLVEHADAAQVHPWIQLIAQDNPWLTQLLDQRLAHQPVLLEDEAQKEEIRQYLFAQIVTDRLSPDLHEVLYNLTKYRPNGFQPEDPLLPAGHTTLNQLIGASFVEFKEDKRCHEVAPVLAGLFHTRSEANVPQQR